MIKFMVNIKDINCYSFIEENVEKCKLTTL